MKLAHVVSVALVSLVFLPACNKTPPSPSASAEGAASASASPASGAKGTAEKELAAGATAPDFTATAHDGTTVHLAALKGKPVVLYFYPKDETPGCTKEACAFRDAWKDLTKAGVVLVGISADSDESHRAFVKHHELPFLLVSDKDGAIAKQYGVPTTLGIHARQSFVVDKDGKVKKVYRSVDVTHHAADVLADVGS